MNTIINVIDGKMSCDVCGNFGFIVKKYHRIDKTTHNLIGSNTFKCPNCGSKETKDINTLIIKKQELHCNHIPL